MKEPKLIEVELFYALLTKPSDEAIAMLMHLREAENNDEFDEIVDTYLA